MCSIEHVTIFILFFSLFVDRLLLDAMAYSVLFALAHNGSTGMALEHVIIFPSFNATFADSFFCDILGEYYVCFHFNEKGSRSEWLFHICRLI